MLSKLSKFFIMVHDNHRHLHRNQTITNTYNNHQINDKIFATISHQTTEKIRPTSNQKLIAQ